jgi:Bacterial regulatory proteins, luxR family.
MSDEQPSSRVAEPSASDLEHKRLLLSDRESDIIRKTRSKSYSTTADELGISESTVGTYRTRATNRLDRQKQGIKLMLRQQKADKRGESIKEIAEEAVECLRSLGIDAELDVQR